MIFFLPIIFTPILIYLKNLFIYTMNLIINI